MTKQEQLLHWLNDEKANAMNTCRDMRQLKEIEGALIAGTEASAFASVIRKVEEIFNISSNALLSDELNRLREGRTHRAIQKCHQWITYCLSIGWKKEDADGLEVIWWLHRDENGNLKAV